MLRLPLSVSVILLLASCDSEPEGDDLACTVEAEEICGDNFDENCRDDDEECPTSASADIQIPDWDCLTGEPPPNVFAWALFSSPSDYYEPGGCFLFFEGLPGEFYAAPVNFEPTAERIAAGPGGMCESVEGCVCPSMDEWSYDRGRLYAFTLEGDAGDCEKIVVTSHDGDDQVVSNDCRKYLHQLHFSRTDFTFVGDDAQALRRRLERFDQVEIACFEGQPFNGLPFVSLLTSDVVFSERFMQL